MCEPGHLQLSLRKPLFTVLAHLGASGCGCFRSHSWCRWVGVGLGSGGSVAGRGRPRSDRGPPARRRTRHAGSASRYTELVVDAIGSRLRHRPSSRGRWEVSPAPLVRERVPVRELVLVNAIIPDPGETARDWWANTGALQAQGQAALCPWLRRLRRGDLDFAMHDCRRRHRG